MEPNIGIEKENLVKMSEYLNKILADEFVIYVKSWNFHWNIVGPAFDPFHKFFQEIYEEQADIVDEVAERIRFLGQRPFSSMQEYLENTSLKENIVTEAPEALHMVGILLADFQFVIKEMRKIQEIAIKLNDIGTNDFIVSKMQQHEKLAWKLRSFVE